ncbi:hypothetical protein [Micromonospora sp. CB01531]|uniref:hypothetical protein n=1 Tax=Micromonospora sp. CB01531 TaxID=1718947 RepID=UPI00093C2257|nr:hypothetical protein [Micromonospora sp. CB01531]OKI54521.1 hypothetical protein A6A27_31850 [Micromonospora sp. CB01531]
MADLTVLVPTRGRIGNSLRLLKAFRETCTADTELVFVISADDPDHDLYYWHLTQADGRAITVSVDKPGVVAPLNAGFEALKGSLGLAVGFMGDDHLPKTRGWDEALLGELKALKTGIAYPNDLLQFEAMATAVVMTSDIPKALGYMAPSELDHMCIDLVWLDWGRGIDKLVYRDDVIIEHLHRSVGKSREDATYRLTRDLVSPDSEKYTTYKETRLSDDLKALSGLLTPAPRKAPAKRAPAKKAAPKKAGA